MNRRHQDQIENRLDALYANGTTFITWGEIYLWYNVTRINKHPWRDMRSRWYALLEEKGQPRKDPLVAQPPGGILLCFGDFKKFGDLAD